jgi:hypothetical protein
MIVAGMHAFTRCPPLLITKSRLTGLVDIRDNESGTGSTGRIEHFTNFMRKMNCN